jgi:putative membrane protein
MLRGSTNSDRGKTMMRLALIAVCAVILATPGSAQSLTERSGFNALFGVSPSTQDFVNEVGMNELLKMEFSTLAEERGSSKTKEFAARLLKDHRETSAQLKALVKSGMVKVSFPAALDSTRQEKLDKLKSLDGAAFDKVFEEMQVSIHNDTISLFERYGNGGDHRDLKLFAFKHLPHLQEHWRLARDLKN